MQVQIASSFLIIFIFSFKDTSLYFLVVSFCFKFLFFFLFCSELMNWEITVVECMKMISAPSLGASFFTQRRARNASDTRVTGDEAQGTAFLNA